MPLTRRELLKGLGVAAGALGLGAAGYENLVPFIRQPDNMIPGVSTWYATSCRECPAGCGIIMENREARSIKAEGNPIHPINRGTLCARGQASLHGLYDPDRIRGPMRLRGNRLTGTNWKTVRREVGEILARRNRIAMITDLQTGSLEVLMHQWLSAFGSDRLVVYEPIDYSSIKNAVGRPVVPDFNIADSDYLISFAADFLETWISPVKYATRFAEMRRVQNGRRGRFVYIGPRVSMTAANADLRIMVAPGTEGAVALAVLQEMGRGQREGFSAEELRRRGLNVNPEDIRRVARELQSANAPLALPGGDINSARGALLLNNVLGSTLVDTSRPHSLSSIAPSSAVDDLIADMENGQIDILMIYGANPVYSLPNSKRFVEALKRVTAISLSTYLDETTAHANWVLPSSSYLESWGDYSPEAGVTNLMQPTMGTLFNTRQTGDILIQLAQSAGVDVQSAFGVNNWYDYLRQRWNQPSEDGPDTPAPQWEASVERGGRWQESVAAVSESIPMNPGSIGALPSVESRRLKIWAYPSIYFYDGRNANRRWLQEMGDPMTRSAWSTWAEIHPLNAQRFGIKTGDVIRITHGNTRIEVPAIVSEGVSEHAVAVPIGQGHTQYGRFSRGTGANAWSLLDMELPDVEIQATGRRQPIPKWQGADSQHHREIARVTELGKPVDPSKIAMPLPEGYKKGVDFYPGHEHIAHRWAMTVDLDRCIGCNACVTACYAENNVAVVGAEGILRERKMAWLRIDRYLDWDDIHAPVQFLPMLCQHCDAAPCESVCPVYAAVHSREGVNEQVYNRCVGTRYCANNCPYKVRRFNWFGYKWPWPMKYQLNPEVTVRDRGVMEKCTFCIQRIREVEIVAKRESRPVRDGEIVPACVQTCPTGVFTFGDLMDPDSRVSRIVRNDPRVYQVLDELNTKPGVIYLKRIVG